MTSILGQSVTPMLIKIGDSYINPYEIAAIQPASVYPVTPAFDMDRFTCFQLRRSGNIMVRATMEEAVAVLIAAGVIEDPDKPKPTLEELLGLN